MFRWYQESQVCYAYLFDVTASIALEDRKKTETELHKCQWFTRGWTLQELLGPETLIFFNCNWEKIGTKESLKEHICNITRITHLFNYESASIAQKMSWASDRSTQRPEDRAYCLMGLFGVNMPLLYGEGEAKAFLRLQVEIMQVSDDESIFAWIDSTVVSFTCGMLAESPAAFKESGDIEQLPSNRSAPYLMTNKGLQIRLTLLSEAESTAMQQRQQARSFYSDNLLNMRFDTVLYCARKGSSQPIILKLLKIMDHLEEYSRIFPHEFYTCTDARMLRLEKTVLVRQREVLYSHRGSTTLQIYALSNDIFMDHNVRFYSMGTNSEWHKFALDSVFFSPQWEPLTEIETTRGSGKGVRLGYGIALINMRVVIRATVLTFILEIDVQQDKSPGLCLWLGEVERVSRKLIASMSDATHLRPFSQDKVEGILKPGLAINASISAKTHLGRISYVINLYLRNLLNEQSTKQDSI